MTDVRIVAKHDSNLARIVKVAFQTDTVVVTSFQNALYGIEPRRLEHFTYPPDGKAHITTDFLDASSHGGLDQDPLELYDKRGRRWLRAGPPLASFTGYYPLACGYIYLSSDAMSQLRLKGPPGPHDFVIEGIGGGVAFTYSVDLVAADSASMAAAIARREEEAKSTQEKVFVRPITHTARNLLICLRGNQLTNVRPKEH